MGLLKKIGLGIIISIAIVGILFLRFMAYYPVENLEINARVSSSPSGDISSAYIDDSLVLFPTVCNIDLQISIRNLNPSEIRLETIEYVVTCDGVEIFKGESHDILLSNTLTTLLPVIRIPLDMVDVVEDDIQMIKDALSNYGKASLKISVKAKMPALFLGAIRIGTAETSDESWVDVDLIDILRVSSFDWRSEELYVEECHPGEDLRGEFRISKTGKTTGVLEAEIIEVTKRGVETLEVIEIEGDLSSSYGTYDVDWCVPDPPSKDCIGYSIHLLYEGIKVWASPLEPLSILLMRRYTLHEALDDEAFAVTMRGRGYCSGDAIKLEVKAELEVTVELEIEPGGVLINSGKGQNMIIAETRVVKIEPGIEVEITLESYCLDLHKDNPNSTEVFNMAMGSGEYSEDSIRLMQSLPDAPWEHKSVSGVQLALWVIIEDPTKSEIKQRFSFGESAVEDAAWLLQNIGIDTDQKKFFSTN